MAASTRWSRRQRCLTFVWFYFHVSATGCDSTMICDVYEYFALQCNVRRCWHDCVAAAAAAALNVWRCTTGDERILMAIVRYCFSFYWRRHASVIASVTNRLIRSGHFSRRLPPDAYPMTMPTRSPTMLSICPSDAQTIVSCGTDCANRVRTMVPILNRPLLPHRSAYCVSAVGKNGILFVWLKSGTCRITARNFTLCTSISVMCSCLAATTHDIRA